MKNQCEMGEKVKVARGHPFSTYVRVSIKLTFLPPDTHTYVCVSGGKKC